MTDANEDQPLTRRELRARERAAELARTGGMPVAPTEAERESALSAPERVGRHSTPSVPADDAVVAEADAVSHQGADAVASEAAAHAAAESSADTQDSGEAAADTVVRAPSKPLGRFFGRKKDKKAAAAPADVAGKATDPAVGEPIAAEPANTELIEAVPVAGAEADGIEVIEAEIAEDAASVPTPAEVITDAPAQQSDSGDGDLAASVPAPSAARRSSVQIDDVQGLDTVDDAAVDDVEIDEVVVEQPRVSSRRIAEVTPAELEDRRAAADDDDTVIAGPSRGQSQRVPVIVNVVPDTSEHHIADLREQGVAGGGGTSTSSITANALVLPAGSENPDFALEGDDGLLVTGSIDVPEGFASSGRGSATIDGNEIDAEVAEGEVSSPETAPVRASKAVSSYANARVQIAPQKQRNNALPVVIGVGAGAFAVGVGAVLVWALSQGIL